MHSCVNTNNKKKSKIKIDRFVIAPHEMKLIKILFHNNYNKNYVKDTANYT